jgi:D-threo-aldose 1-dehydrogenase
MTLRLGLGTAPLGGLYPPVSADVALETVDAAWELGVRFFDTAPLYGSGLAEERLGQALAHRPRQEYTSRPRWGVSSSGGPGRPLPRRAGAPARLRLERRG